MKESRNAPSAIGNAGRAAVQQNGRWRSLSGATPPMPSRAADMREEASNITAAASNMAAPANARGARPTNEGWARIIQNLEEKLGASNHAAEQTARNECAACAAEADAPLALRRRAERRLTALHDGALSGRVAWPAADDDASDEAVFQKHVESSLAVDDALSRCRAAGEAALLEIAALRAEAAALRAETQALRAAAEAQAVAARASGDDRRRRDEADLLRLRQSADAASKREALLVSAQVLAQQEAEASRVREESLGLELDATAAQLSETRDASRAAAMQLRVARAQCDAAQVERNAAEARCNASEARCGASERRAEEARTDADAARADAALARVEADGGGADEALQRALEQERAKHAALGSAKLAALGSAHQAAHAEAAAAAETALRQERLDRLEAERAAAQAAHSLHEAHLRCDAATAAGAAHLKALDALQREIDALKSKLESLSGAAPPHDDAGALVEAALAKMKATFAARLRDNSRAAEAVHERNQKEIDDMNTAAVAANASREAKPLRASRQELRASRQDHDTASLRADAGSRQV
ncbi:hypothetical protein M885DRAFT_526199 [Pelagophyceae sp. CCMP2097]|nr:hypothetical protein M885DRAFT_526199 [Pelagophyceae sp. CCMP2097]